MSPLDVAALRGDTVIERAEMFLDQIIVDEGIKELLDPLKEIAHERGASQGFIDSLTLTKWGFMQIAIALDYVSDDGKPLGLWLEKGTKKHWLEPLWMHGGDPEGPGSLHWTKDGKNYFSMGHMHPGFEGYHILPLIKLLFPKFQTKVINRTNDFLERTRFK